MDKFLDSDKIDIEAMYKTLTLVWFAMLMSQFIFLAVIFFTKPEAFSFNSSNFLGREGFILLPILGVFGIILFAMSFIFRKKHINQAINEQNPSLVQQALILSCAFCEAVSILGLVIAFVTGSPLFLLWFALGILGTVLSFPKRDSLIAASYKKQ